MRHLWLRFGYRHWARLLHRFNLHHTTRIGPMEDGVFIHRCDWCGVSRTEYRGLAGRPSREEGMGTVGTWTM